MKTICTSVVKGVCVLLLLGVVGCKKAQDDVVNYVNPLIGTDYVGNTYPGAQVPFGMVQLSPDNGLPGWDRIAGYYYPDSTIAGFSHTHLQGTGAGDLYDISFLPVAYPLREAEPPLGVHSLFDHSSEQVEAGYYRVELKDYRITVELTATERVGIQRYHFPEPEATVLLNLAKAMNWDATLDTHIEQRDAYTICGYRYSTGWARDQRVYFATQFSHPISSLQLDTTLLSGGGKGLVAQMHYDMQGDKQLLVRTALSGVSIDGAMRNLQQEAPHNSFEQYRTEAKRRWYEELSRVRVEGGSDDERTCFYTALYHSFTAPTLFADVDSAYRGCDKQIHRSACHVNYSTFSLWDTYRAAHPLYTLLQPERTNDMMHSLVAHYRESGALPVWSFYANETDMMIGYHAVPVLVDAVLKGVTSVDAEEVLEACVVTANRDSYRGIGLYKQLGYVPYDVEDAYNSDNWSLSRTLEYAFDDYCIALLAQHLGHDSLTAQFRRRSEAYKNVYNPATQFFQPRNSKGEFQPNFDATQYTPHICESNAWHYLWSVQHDVPALIALLGEERFEQRLDSMFSYAPMEGDALPIFSTGMIGQYAHGNEPSHHVAYLYNAIRKPWVTQRLVRKIRTECYAAHPAGLCGNEDCGQMSAWYVLSAMGLYPVNPVGGRYEIGVPLFNRITVPLGGNKQLDIQVKGALSPDSYIQRIWIDGKEYRKSYLLHSDLVKGAAIVFEMGSEPRCWY